MRYRLRTLLIAITAACIYLAWVGYCHRMAAFYRERSSQIISQLAERSGWTHESLEQRVSQLFELYPNDAAQMGNPEFVFQGSWNEDYASAVVQESIARKYDRAAWYPWTLISN